MFFIIRFTEFSRVHPEPFRNFGYMLLFWLEPAVAGSIYAQVVEDTLTAMSVSPVIGFATGLLLSMALITVAPRFGWVDHPDQNRKSHKQPIALTGG